MKKTPLEALQTIANVEMKEAYKVRKNGLTYRTIADDYGKELSIIEKALRGSKKSDIQKAFEIIKKKKVTIPLLLNTDSVEEYNEIIKHSCVEAIYKPLTLTKEEYDLLKEMLL